ncbi:uncharacterized protein CIMG_07066 [Coccidioides immitis RS]|uniref:FAD-binding domain-containing protein n=3 Tax=Coccidioides immitis TaxID=5501 RepID=J3K9J6_COCIM|nr:uncharacterized protein CIMG_07066 [Coccidioides immitis RS]EAS31587.3 hypothetical protein CIMG_07066 [Coccidioides immitis RS]KMP04234.1 hypothetical protein CIRG_03925 [Coccidioides immitis RMSCC 2394]KMU87053.1 hypothetical protein CIHG_04993 [Coccidioides immitis H538.4]
MSVQADLPIIIVGAGLVGLTLAQALKSEGIPFEIYERDSGLNSRYGGWAISLHWAMKPLASCLPPELYAQIPKIHVHPEVADRDRIPSVYLNLETGKPKFAAETQSHYRVHRIKLREILSQGIDIKWNKAFTGYKVTNDGVVVSFADGTEVKGTILAAADGKNSRAKSMLMGREKAALHDLPIAFIGLKLRGDEEYMKPFHSVAPVLWQGTHPATGVYIFCSRVSTPQLNGSAGSEKEYHEVQFNMSWIMKEDESPIPADNAGKIAKLKEKAKEGTGFYPGLRKALDGITDDQEALDIKLQDWPTLDWDVCSGGRVTILGDAAHPMTMYRGEAANHGMYDAVLLKNQIQLWRNGKKSLEQAIRDFQTEMRIRANEAVLLSRQACFDSHFLDSLTLASPLLSIKRRLV